MYYSNNKYCKKLDELNSIIMNNSFNIEIFLIENGKRIPAKIAIEYLYYRAGFSTDSYPFINEINYFGEIHPNDIKERKELGIMEYKNGYIPYFNNNFSDIYPNIIKIIPIELNIDKFLLDNKPKKIEFIINDLNKSEMSTYSYNFNFNGRYTDFNPSIENDNSGRQIHIFNPGEYDIAVLAKDNIGIYGFKVIKIYI